MSNKNCPKDPLKNEIKWFYNFLKRNTIGSSFLLINEIKENVAAHYVSTPGTLLIFPSASQIARTTYTHTHPNTHTHAHPSLGVPSSLLVAAQSKAEIET